MGFAVFAAPGYWAGIPTIFGLICGQKVLDITTAQKNSTVHAVKYYNYHIWRTGQSDGQYYIRATLHSQ
jgi:hypothetical protein